MDEEQSQIAARLFLRTGEAVGISELELARGCENLIQKASRTSLNEALKLARRFAAVSRHHSPEMRLTAARAVGRLSHMSGRHRDARRAYLSARRLSERSPLVRARIDRALADVYLYLGDYDKAKQSARRAMAAFKALKADNDWIQARVNYANILHRQDRHREAEKIYHQAADYFDASGNRLALARCYYNRANVLLQLFDIAAAERLYRDSEKIYAEAGCTLDANDARYGLAWLWMLTGKFHQALLQLAACEKIYRDGGDHRGEALCALDRAEVYLGLGLNHDAFDISALAEKRFAVLGLQYERSKASLFRAQAALRIGRKTEAEKAVVQALKGFSREKNGGFLGVSQLTAADLVRAKSDSSKRTRYLNAARKQFSRAQLPLWEAICDLRLSYEKSLSSVAVKRLKRNRALREMPHLSIAWQTRLGELKQAQGDLAAARNHWETAAETLDLLRAQLPPLDLRSAFARAQNSPHRKLIDMELKDSPMRAAVWSERFKTAGIWAPLISESENATDMTQIQRNLGLLARQVAALSHQIYEGNGKRGFTAATHQAALQNLRREIRESMLACEPDKAGSSYAPEQLAANFRHVSSEHPVVQFHLQDDDIIIFLHRQGTVETHRLEKGRIHLQEILLRWRFLLESELLTGYLTSLRNFQSERSLLSELGDMLWAPLRLDESYHRILIIPEGELSNIPWAALYDNDGYLADRFNFVIAPSLRHYINARKVYSASSRWHLFQGAAANIPHVSDELESLLAQISGNAALSAPCRRKDIIDAPEAAVWHYSGHAQFCTDNPFYSYLALEDGPLFAADLRAKRCRVNLVTLAGCRSGEQLVLPGDEATGLVRSLLEMGARNIIAALWPLSDESASFWMISYYNKMRENNSILESARWAAGKVRERFPSAYHWAAFSVFGAGDMGGAYDR